MVIACRAATHTLAPTLPHVVRLPVTPLILYTPFKVLVNNLKTFSALHTTANDEQLTSVILLQWVLNSLVTTSLCPQEASTKTLLVQKFHSVIVHLPKSSLI